MTIIIGTLRLLDREKRERGRLEVAVDADIVSLATQRDGVTERLFLNPTAAERLAGYLDLAADKARGA